MKRLLWRSNWLRESVRNTPPHLLPLPPNLKISQSKELKDDPAGLTSVLGHACATAA